MQRSVYRVKGIVRSNQMSNIWECLSRVRFTRTPTVKFERTLQDKKCSKQLDHGKRRKKRKNYGKYSYIEFKSPNHSDMVNVHEILERFFVPGSDSSNI